jgi:hypothetical protein
LTRVVERATVRVEVGGIHVVLESGRLGVNECLLALMMSDVVAV